MVQQCGQMLHHCLPSATSADPDTGRQGVGGQHIRLTKHQFRANEVDGYRPVPIQRHHENPSGTGMQCGPGCKQGGTRHGVAALRHALPTHNPDVTEITFVRGVDLSGIGGQLGPSGVILIFSWSGKRAGCPGQSGHGCEQLVWSVNTCVVRGQIVEPHLASRVPTMPGE